LLRVWFAALIELVEPSITVRVNDEVAVLLPMVSCIPLGLEARVICTVRGSRRTV
jgi:hypothetical protein